MNHSEDCLHPSVHEGRDATGVRYWTCFGCDAFEHEPLVFGRRSHLGHLSRWPDLERTPYGHESGLLEFPNHYSLDFTFHRAEPERLPVIKNPVPIVFNPAEVIVKEDGGDHEGTSFREVWSDPLARLLWLGHKPFMLTNQYFRGYCVGHATDLRQRPDQLLRECVTFHFDGGFGGDRGWYQAIGAQLVPYLICALDAEGLWPYFKLPGRLVLGWKYKPERKAA